MLKAKKAFIIDVDNVLIDSEKIKALWKSRFQSKFSVAYKKSKGENGFPDIKLLSTLLETDESYFYKVPFKKYLIKNSLLYLSKLKKEGTVKIVTLGDSKYQLPKLKESGILKIVGSKNIVISRDKKRDFTKIINTLNKGKYAGIFVIDDVAANIALAKKINPNVSGIWVRYGKHKNEMPILQSTVDFEGSTFTDAAKYLLRVVATVKIPKSAQKVSVIRGIDEKETSDLVKITKNDSKIAKFTHDMERFKSIKSFNAWKRRKKYIYVLIEKTGKLKGIVWFSQKLYKGIPFTIGIRIYKPLRGKGLSKKFMKCAIDDFLPINKRGLWLKVNSNNLPAINLYKSLGFKTIDEDKSEEKVMILKGF